MFFNMQDQDDLYEPEKLRTFGENRTSGRMSPQCTVLDFNIGSSVAKYLFVFSTYWEEDIGLLIGCQNICQSSLFAHSEHCL